MGKRKFGVEIWDGRSQTKDMVKASDLILMTGTTEYLIYGVTASGVNKLLGFHGICPFGRA